MIKKLLPLLLGFIGLLPISAKASAPLDLEKFLTVIRELEGVKNPKQFGKDGELGYLRITPGTWVMYMTVPHRYCGIKPELELTCARKNIDGIISALRSRNLEVSVYSLAVCWNGGVYGYIKYGGSRLAKDYGRRAANLYGAQK